MAFENGFDWQPLEPERRGRHATFRSAVDAAVADLLKDRDPFYTSLVGNWKRYFPNLAATPGHRDGSCIYLYVRSAAANYAIRGRLPAIRRQIAALPGAPRRLDVRLEIHK